MSSNAKEIPQTMKAAILHRNGDPTNPDVLSVKDDVLVPSEPKEGQILVRVVAASINPVDWKLMEGSFPGLKSGPVGADVSGTVVKVGPNTKLITSLSVGDEVYGDTIDTMGSFAEYVICNANVLYRKPVNASHQEAASLPLAGLTALQGLQLHGNFQPGQKVLILGGSGGVGSLAIQMAKALGASKVYSTGSSVDTIQKLGADVVINYKEESLMESLKGQDIDLVFDTVGGYENWQVAKASMKKGGRFVTIVGDGGNFLTMILKWKWRQLMGNIKVGPHYTFFLTNTKYDGLGDDMKKITDLVENGKIKAVLDGRKFQLTTDDVHAMIKASMSHHAKGKLVLEVA